MKTLIISKKKNRKKSNRLNVRNEIENILIFDIKTNSRIYIKWSGEDVLYHSDIENYRNKWNKLIESLENFNIIIYHQNSNLKTLQKIRKAFYELAINEFFDYFILCIVIINSFFLALDGNIFMPETLDKLNISNYIFNGIFIFEYIIKFIGLGPIVYYSDPFTFLDTIIICFAIVDIVTPNNNDIDVVGVKKSVSSQLSFLRVFRIFRIVRLAKILKRLDNMRFILIAVNKSLTSASVYYIIIILIMFVLIFELLGMSLLNGNKHFQSFLDGFYTTYQILTLENWDGIFIEIWPLNHLCIFYFVLWIFLGNYILFNLFISILIQSFGENQKSEKREKDDFDEEDIEKIYDLPDYLTAIKNKVKEGNLSNFMVKRKKTNKVIVNNILNNLNTYSNSNSRGANTRFSSSYFNNSQIFNNSDDDDEEEVEKKNFFYSQTMIKDNDEDSNIMSIGKSKEKFRQQINKLFINNECEKSLFFIPQNSWFRINCAKLINSIWFDKFILLTIVLSTIRLIIDTFINGYSSVLIFDVCDTVFNIIFLIEAILKILAWGFALDEGSYLTDNWNKLDALIVICSFIEFHNITQKYFASNNNTSSIEFLKVLRLLRTLRPLRFISHNMDLKLIITSLYDSLISIINVLIILLVVLFMFSIVGISLFYSYYHNCYVLKQNGSFNLATNSFNNILALYEVRNDITSISKFCADKYNGIMDTGPAFKFSNIKTSLITSYILSTMEGWPDIMNSYRIYDDLYGIYFIGFNFIVAYFFLNLFTGIMFKYFNEAYSRELKISKDDKNAPEYFDYLNQIIGAQSNYIIWNKPMKGTIKSYLRAFVDSEIFENSIMIIIGLNTILMCLSHDGSSEKFINILKAFNNFFTFIFIFECLLKLFAYGIRPYFLISWNKFDFFIIIVSIIDWTVTRIKGIDAAFLKSFQVIRVLKVLRVSRVIRLVRALGALKKYIQTVQYSLNALINILSLIMVIHFIVALIGCYLYDGQIYEEFKDKFTYINEYYNMDNFYNSYLLILRCSTGENWHNIMMEMAYREDNSGEAYSIAFFILSNFVTSIILSNLLLMVTLQKYDEFNDKEYNFIETFNSFLSNFNNSWNKFSTEEDEGFRIKKTLVIQFFMELELNWTKLNFPEKGKIEYIKKFVNDLELNIDNEDYAYYHDVIFKLIYKQMGMKIDRNNPENITIFKTEKAVQKQIRNMINSYIYKRKGRNNTLITYNPLTAHLLYKFSFIYLKRFVNYYKENLELLQHLGEGIGDEEEIENDESIEISDNNENDESISDSFNSNKISSSNLGSDNKITINKDANVGLKDNSNKNKDDFINDIYSYKDDSQCDKILDNNENKSLINEKK